MVEKNNVSALKVGCGKFFCGEGMAALLPQEIKRLGGKALIIGGPTGLKTVLNATQDAMQAAGVEYIAQQHTDFCTMAWIEKYAQMAKDNHCTVLVGCGGGKCVDIAKGASVLCGLPVITVPTSVATCCGTSMVAIMYNEAGQRVPDVKLEKEVDVCIADVDLIATAPPRTLASGIMDSIAKYPECLHQKKGDSYRDCSHKEYIQIVNARAIYGFLMGEARDLYQNGGKANRFKDVVLTNLLHTSIVSGFADGSGQMSIGHAVYDYMRTNHTKNSLAYMHGELVAVGVLAQMIYNQTPEAEIEAVRSLMKDMDMPTTLLAADYDAEKEDFNAMVESIAETCGVQPQDKERLYSAVQQITR